MTYASYRQKYYVIVYYCVLFDDSTSCCVVKKKQRAVRLYATINDKLSKESNAFCSISYIYVIINK